MLRVSTNERRDASRLYKRETRNIASLQTRDAKHRVSTNERRDASRLYKRETRSIASLQTRDAKHRVSRLLINMFGQSPEQVAATKQDPNQAPLEEKEKAMLLFVLKSVKTPTEVTEQDVQALRALGWEEGDILDATAHGARHVAIDILFNTFKIEKDF